MPQDKLQQLMLNRPVRVSGEVQYPKDGDPSVVDDKGMRFLGNLLGIDEQKPGDAAGAAGAALGVMLPIFTKNKGMAIERGIRTLNNFKEDYPTAKPAVTEALEMAQKRWPRLFGHVEDIQDIAPIDKEAGTAGQSWRGVDINREGGRTSKMRINVDEQNPDIANFITGHEMLHNADRIVNPDFDKKYQYIRNLVGYPTMSDELRADMQGIKTAGYSRGLPRKVVGKPNKVYPIIKDVKYTGFTVPEDK